MHITPFMPLLDYDGNGHFTELQSGWQATWDPVTHTGVEESALFTGYKMINPLFNFLRSITPEVLPLSVLTANDLNDIKRDTPGTGGSRRGFSSPSFRYLFQNIAGTRQVGLGALESWNRDQLNRPHEHLPWQFNCDSYSCVLTSGWKWGKKTPQGWNAFDVSHMQHAEMVALSSVGSPLGMMNLWMLWRWAVSSHKPGQSHWMTEPRAIGWLIGLATWAHMAGFGYAQQNVINTYTAGFTPRQAIREWVKHLVDGLQRPGKTYEFWNSGPTVKKGWSISSAPAGFNNTAFYGWQQGIALWNLALCWRSGVLAGLPEHDKLELLCQQIADRLINYCWKPGQGMAWTFGVEVYDTQEGAQAHADALNAVRNASSDPIEIHQVTAWRDRPAGWIVRRRPEKDDAHIQAAGIAMVYGPDNPTVKDLMDNVLDRPGSNNFEDRYMASAYADLEKGWSPPSDDESSDWDEYFE